jgi:hypothetical protein
VPPLMAGPRPAELPLSFAQQRLWFLDQLHPGAATYNLPFGLRFAGRLNVSAVARALTDLVARHEVLRTTFAAHDGQPAQRIASAATVALPVLDIAALPAREAVARRLADHEAHRPFDLSQGPLRRAHLMRLAPEDHVLLVTVHHIVCDGTSSEILARDLAALYRAHTTGRPSDLQTPAIQYADYAIWQRAWIQGDVLEAHLAWWRRQLHGARGLRLPTDRPRTPAVSDRADLVRFSLRAALTDRLRTFSRRENVTLFMTLLAAFQAVLHEASGQADVIVGSPRDNRDELELEAVAGFFINTLPLRATFPRGLSFRALLRQVREMVLGALAHDHAPFEAIVDSLAPGRSAGQNPIVQVWFVLQDAVHTPAHTWPGVVARPFETTLNRAKLDLALAMHVGATEISGSLTYLADLYEPDTIVRLAMRFESLLIAALDNPDMLLTAMPPGLNGVPAADESAAHQEDGFQDAFAF